SPMRQPSRLSTRVVAAYPTMPPWVNSVTTRPTSRLGAGRTRVGRAALTPCQIRMSTTAKVTGAAVKERDVAERCTVAGDSLPRLLTGVGAARCANRPRAPDPYPVPRAASHPDFHRRPWNSTRSAGRRSGRVADCHRRFGLSPTPEHVGLGFQYRTPAGAG